MVSGPANCFSTSSLKCLWSSRCLSSWDRLASLDDRSTTMLFELDIGGRGSKGPSANVLLLSLIAMIFLLHPEGFFWTAVDVCVQLVMMGSHVLARIPFLLQEHKIAAALIIFWVFALLAIQFRKARTVPHQPRSLHSRKSKRKRPSRRLSPGCIHESSRHAGRSSPNRVLSEKDTLAKTMSVEMDDEDDDDDGSSLPDQEDVSATVASCRVEKGGAASSSSSKGRGSVGRGGSADTASVRNNDSNHSSPSSRSERTSSSHSGRGSGKAHHALSPPTAPPSYVPSPSTADKGGSWKQPSAPPQSGSVGFSSKRENQSSRSARPSRPFSEDFHQQQHQKKRLGSPASSASPSASSPVLSSRSSATSGSHQAARAGVAAKPSPRAGQSFYYAVTGSLPSNSTTPRTRVPSPLQLSPQSMSSASPVSWQRQQQRSVAAGGTSWRPQDVDRRIPTASSAAWVSSPEQRPAAFTSTPPPAAGGLFTPAPVRPTSQREPVQSSPPGFLSVKAEPFHPSSQRVLPSTPTHLAVDSPLSPYGSFYSPPQPHHHHQSDVSMSSCEHSEDSRLEMSMFALSHQMCQDALGGDL